MPREKLTSGQRRVLTTIRRHGVRCYRQWGKMGWEPRTRRKPTIDKEVELND